MKTKMNELYGVRNENAKVVGYTRNHEFGRFGIVVEWRCNYCNKKHITLKSSVGKYCNNSCRIKGLHKYMKEDNVGFYNSETQRKISLQIPILKKVDTRKKGNHVIGKFKFECKYCKKIEMRWKCHIDGDFCSRKCYLKYNKKHSKGFFSTDFHVNGGKRSVQINRKRGTGLWGMSKEEKSKHSRKNGKKSMKTMKKNKIGFFDKRTTKRWKEIQAAGGRAAMLSILDHSKHVWLDVHFASKSEMQLAKKLLRKPVLGVNYQVRVGTKLIDFHLCVYCKLAKLKDNFVEFHPHISYLHKYDSDKRYYNRRRKVLDENGFKDKRLILITDINEVKNL